MSAYADASAVVKLYVFEERADVVRSLGMLAVSTLTRVEVASALWRKRRSGALTAEMASVLTRRFEAEWRAGKDRDRRFVPISVNHEILEHAVRLVAAHDLRAGDAVQLASALAAREADPYCRDFACFDRRLADAAATEGFAVVPSD